MAKRRDKGNWVIRWSKGKPYFAEANFLTHGDSRAAIKKNEIAMLRSRIRLREIELKSAKRQLAAVELLSDGHQHPRSHNRLGWRVRRQVQSLQLSKGHVMPKVNVNEVKQLIQKLFEDTSVSQETTFERLQELKDEIDMLIDSLDE